MNKIVVDIDHLADLARLDLTDEEKAIIAPQLNNILTYVGKLAEVDTSGVSPNVSITDLRNIWREDVVVACDDETQKLCLDAFPKKVGTALSVPGIFEERTE